MAELTRVKKHLNYLFLDTTPGEDTETWKRAGKSTDFAIAMNNEQETFDYIADESPTTELKSYKPTVAQTQAAYIGDPIYDYVFDLYNQQATGSDAVSKGMIVYQQKSGNPAPVYTVTTAEPADWATNYEDYYTVSNGVYSNVTGETAPEWEAGTYYKKTEAEAPNVAIQFEALITIDTYDIVAGTITYTIEQRGTATKGTATVTNGQPEFTAAA
jgi:hypothetical protein